METGLNAALFNISTKGVSHKVLRDGTLVMSEACIDAGLSSSVSVSFLSPSVEVFCCDDRELI